MFDQLWISFGITAAVALLQWRFARKLHLRSLARAQAKHLKAQQLADRLLQQSRQQYTQLQHELEAARLAMRRHQRPEPPAIAPPQVPKAAAREVLMKMLDTAPATRRPLPADGFAETMPSMQFQTSAMGSI